MCMRKKILIIVIIMNALYAKLIDVFTWYLTNIFIKYFIVI